MNTEEQLLEARNAGFEEGIIHRKPSPETLKMFNKLNIDVSSIQKDISYLRNSHKKDTKRYEDDRDSELKRNTKEHDALAGKLDEFLNKTEKQCDDVKNNCASKQVEKVVFGLVAIVMSGVVVAVMNGVIK